MRIHDSFHYKNHRLVPAIREGRYSNAYIGHIREWSPKTEDWFVLRLLCCSRIEAWFARTGLKQARRRAIVVSKDDASSSHWKDMLLIGITKCMPPTLVLFYFPGVILSVG